MKKPFAAIGLTLFVVFAISPAPAASAAPVSEVHAADSSFRDTLRSGGQGPEMMVIPAGRFLMGCVSGSDCDDEKPVHEVGRYRPNAFGLYDMEGNVYEWVQDCWNNSYVGAPTDARAWTSGDCGLRVVRGGAWGYGPSLLRSASRHALPRWGSDSYLGFRLIQDL